MTTANKQAVGFEGREAFDALLKQAGSPLQHAEVVFALRQCVEEDLLPSEAILQVLGKQSRALPTELLQRLASNVFALYDSVGQEPDPTTRQELTEQILRLQGQASAMQPHAFGSSLDQLEEFIDALSSVSQELERSTMTRRYLSSVRHSLQHLQLCLERTERLLAVDSVNLQ